MRDWMRGPELMRSQMQNRCNQQRLICDLSREAGLCPKSSNLNKMREGHVVRGPGDDNAASLTI